MLPTAKYLQSIDAIAIAAVILGSFGTSPTSWAQAAGSDSGAAADNQELRETNARPIPPSEETGSQLEEVTITAQRYEQSLQDVPISISAFSSEDIEARSTDGLKGFTQFVPNLTFSNASASGASGNLIYMRGIGNNDGGIEFSPGVGVYVDGVYIGVMRGLDLSLVDVERLEVLRGPQGTLFGRNTTGGAINVISKRPGDEFEGKASIGFGSFETKNADLSLNVPIVPDRFETRFSLLWRKSDGYGKHVDSATGEEIGRTGDDDTLAGRAAFELTPTDNLNFLLTIDALRSRAHVPPYHLFATAPVAAVPAYGDGSAYISNDPFVNYAKGDDANDADAFGAALISTIDLSDQWTLTSTTGFRDIETLYFIDVDAGPFALFQSWQSTKQHQFSQEVLLNGKSFGGRLESVLGVFYYTDHANSDRPSAGGLVTDLPSPPFGVITNAIQSVENTSWAVFGQSTVHLTDKLSFTGGLRYTEDELDSTGPTQSISGLKWNALTGRAGFEYRWTGDLMSYVSAARGYKNGGLNSIGSGAAFTPFEPETLWTYEIGLKSELFDRRIRVNAALFRSDYSDLQFRQRINLTGGGVLAFIGNAAEAEIFGGELEVVAAPTDDLLINLAVGHTDGKYLEVSAPVTAQTGLSTSKEFMETPKWTASAGVQYTYALKASAKLVGRLDYSYRTDIEHDLANNPRLQQPSYGLLNARLTYENVAGDWSLAVYGTNLTDEHYFLSGIDFATSRGFAIRQYAPPRAWGVTLRKSF